MKRTVAFALIPEKGHINPYIGPAQALQQMGFTVAVAAPGDISAQIRAAGLPFYTDLIPPVSDDRVTSGAELVALIQNPAALDRWIEQLLLDPIDSAAPAIEAWLARIRADVVVIDPLFYGAAIASHRLRIPWTAVSNSLNPVVPRELDSALLRTIRRIAPRRDALFAQYGCEGFAFRGADVLSPHLTLVFATEALVGPPPDGVILSGPSFPIGPRGDEVELRPLPAGKPILYASFGSQIYHWPEIFDRIHKAAERLGAHSVFSTGSLTFDRPNCDAYSYAPQLELLIRHARAFITHGGANSVMEAMAAQVPMLVSPMCNDQFHNAYFVERSKRGFVLDLRTATVEAIAAALSELLNRPRPAERQERPENGALAAARHIARLAS